MTVDMYEHRGPGRPKLFTREILTQIPQWVKSGMTKPEIAERIGTTVPSLSVMCSYYGIPLRSGLREFKLSLPAEVKAKLSMKARDLDMTPAQLGALLIESVVDDNLFKAVLDLEGD
jgi:hypothetical protein